MWNKQKQTNISARCLYRGQRKQRRTKQTQKMAFRWQISSLLERQASHANLTRKSGKVFLKYSNKKCVNLAVWVTVETLRWKHAILIKHLVIQYRQVNVNVINVASDTCLINMKVGWVLRIVLFLFYNSHSLSLLKKLEFDNYLFEILIKGTSANILPFLCLFIVSSSLIKTYRRNIGLPLLFYIPTSSFPCLFCHSSSSSLRLSIFLTASNTPDNVYFVLPQSWTYLSWIHLFLNSVKKLLSHDKLKHDDKCIAILTDKRFSFTTCNFKWLR